MENGSAGFGEARNDSSLESSGLSDHEVFFSIMKCQSVVVGIETSSL